ncbi:MAG: cation/H(+) antiporter [Bacteroidetes bacterium]|nr:MAG: cation/H(+) antiporter [Bacteroidota bacterium]
MQKYMNKTFVFYASTILVFGSFLWLILHHGIDLEVGKNIKIIEHNTSGIDNFLKDFSENLHHPLARLILQIITIVFFARLFGSLAAKIGQPTVIGEIVAGIILGPSLVGMLFPEFSLFLFPVDSLKNLQALSQLGLILFMFIIGMELDISILQKKASDAIVVSHASIIFPYFLGVSLAYFIYTDFTNEGVSFLSFALFMGIAMSITAFPVLARIVQERGLTKTPLGTMAITCAAADDVTAWCILAAVIAIVKAGTATNALFTLALSVIYVALMIYVVRPIMQKVGEVYVSKENLSKTVVGMVFLVMLASAYLGEIIGIHALFGAFLAGSIMPANMRFKEVLTEKIEDLSLVLLLPLFFVFTGLRTQIGLLNEGSLWLMCGLIIAVAVIGKFVGSALAARWVGQSWKDSLTLGALMNTRGLMELIVLNIGYDLGILSPEVFAMMVLMALTTTFMTGPALDLINYLFKEKPVEVVEIVPVFKILISFGQPQMGSRLLQVVDQMTHEHQPPVEITALHMTPSSEISYQDALLFEKEGFEPIKETAEELGILLKTDYKATAEVGKEIIKTANEGNFDLLLVGSAKPIFSDDKIGGKVRYFLEDSNCGVGVFIDKGFKNAKKIVLLVSKQTDFFLIEFAKRFAKGYASKLIILDITNSLINNNLKTSFPLTSSVEIVQQATLDSFILYQTDMILVSLEYWKELSNSQIDWLEGSPSILILRDKLAAEA